MPAVSKKWMLMAHDADAVTRFAAELKVAPVVAQLLRNRGLTEAVLARRFLDASLTGLHAPQNLPGVPEAVERIYSAVQRRERICIYGDYDVDGVTGSAVLIGLLRRLGADVTFYVPHRLEEGYGLNADALNQIATDGAKLVVTVDCGITGVAEAEAAKQAGMDIVVTDHHEMKEQLPAAVLVHPRLPGTDYPFGGLSGAGVAFKLAWALAVRHCGSEKVTEHLRNYLLDALTLATLGLVADVVPLQDENRILVKAGLARMNVAAPIGIQALRESAKLAEGGAIRAEDIAFRLAPRLNAAGRLGCARLVVEMLTTDDPKRARETAEFLESQNVQRQTIERRMTAEAKELAELDEANARAAAAVIAHDEWHPGVVGIVAGRMVEHLGKPVILIALRGENEIATGSGRSVPGFPLHEALKACDDLLVGHGGHAMAVGVKVMPDRIDAFRTRFVEFAEAHFPKGEAPAPQLRIDAEVPFNVLTPALLRDLDRLEPYGAENPRPRFMSGGLQVTGEPRKLGGGERHLSFQVRQGSITLRAIAFGMADRLEELMSAGGKCSLAFTPKLNTWQGMNRVELEVADLQAGDKTRFEIVERFGQG